MFQGAAGVGIPAWDSGRRASLEGGAQADARAVVGRADELNARGLKGGSDVHEGAGTAGGDAVVLLQALDGWDTEPRTLAEVARRPLKRRPGGTYLCGSDQMLLHHK